jgi:amidophosphoribosyltransferase
MSCTSINPAITSFECSVFDGHYVTGDVDDAYLNELEMARLDGNKASAASTTVHGSSMRLDPVSNQFEQVIGLHNHK